MEAETQKASSSLLPPGHVKLLARLPSEAQEQGKPIEVVVPLEATLPLLRALRRTLEAVPEVANGDTAWAELFEGFGAGGSDLAGGECKTCGVDGEALRVRLAAAEARLAAATRQQLTPPAPPPALPLEEPKLQDEPAPEVGHVPAPCHALLREVPMPVEDPSPNRNFSLSAELWRLREALAKANGAKDKGSDLEVQRLQKALEQSHQKLQHYESKEADFFPPEPDTARTRVAHDEESRPVPATRPADGWRPASRPEYVQGVQGTVIKVVPRGQVSGHATSPSPMRPTSPVRKTHVELAMSPPTRPVQFSPHPWRGRLTDTSAVPRDSAASLREAPSGAVAMAANAMAATASLGTPSRPLATQSPPRPERHWPRGSSVAKGTPQVVGRSVATPAPKRGITWTTPRVAPPAPLVAPSSVTKSPTQVTRTTWSLAAPAVSPEALSPQRVRIAASPSLVEIRTKVTQVSSKDLTVLRAI